MAVVVECNGAVLPSAVTSAGFVDGHAEVTVSDLSPGNPYSLRCRCQLEDRDVDPDTLWSPPVTVATLRPPRHAAEDYPPEVLRVMCTSAVLRVRNPGVPGSLLGLRGVCVHGVPGVAVGRRATSGPGYVGICAAAFVWPHL
jgi:hypothetical protein